jgi:O-antigen/teichoic acid export membrane protein
MTGVPPPDAVTADEQGDHRAHALDTARGGGFLAGGSIFEFGTRFFIALLLARLLGADDYGLYVLALSAGALFASISGLGLDDALVRYVAIRAARRDEAGLWGTLQIGLGLSLPFAVAMGLVCYLAADPIASGLFDEPALAPLLRLMALLVPFLTLSNMLNGISRGFERTDVTALGENVVQSLVRLALLSLIALGGRLDTWTAVVVFGVSDVASSVTMWFLLNRSTVPMRQLVRPGAERPVREVFGFAMPLWLSGLLSQSRNRIESVILGVTVGVASVGIYAIVQKVTLLGHVTLLAIFSAVKPVLARLHDQGDRAGMASLYTTATRWTLTLYLPFFLVVVLLAEPILGIFGATFTVGATAMYVLAAAELANAGTGICRSMIDMTGHTRVKLINSVVFTVTLIGGGLVLIPRHAIVGAALATLISQALVNTLSIIQVWWLEGLQPFDRSFLKPIAAAGAGTLAGLLLRRWVPDPSAVGAMVQAVGIGLVYLAALWTLRLPDEDRYVLARGAAWGRRRLVTQQRALVAALSRGRSA